MWWPTLPIPSARASYEQVARIVFCWIPETAGASPISHSFGRLMLASSSLTYRLATEPWIQYALASNVERVDVQSNNDPTRPRC